MGDFWNRLRPLAQDVAVAATSANAERIYLVALLCLVLVISLRIAQRQDKFLKSFDCELRAVDDLEVRKPGPPPTSSTGLKRRIAAVSEKFNEVRQSLNSKLASHGSRLFFSGLIVPSLVVGIFLYAYDWLAPNHEALAYLGQQQGVIAHASIWQIFAVVVAQLVLGLESASKSIETFLVPLFAAGNERLPTYNSADPLIAWTILIFRFVIAGFIATLVYMGAQFATVRLMEPKQLRMLRKQLRAAEKLEAAKLGASNKT